MIAQRRNWLARQPRSRVTKPVGVRSKRQGEPEPSPGRGRANQASRQAMARVSSKARLNARMPIGKEFGHAVRHCDTREFESDCERTRAQPVGPTSKWQAGPEPRRAAGRRSAGAECSRSQLDCFCTMAGSATILMLTTYQERLSCYPTKRFTN